MTTVEVTQEMIEAGFTKVQLPTGSPREGMAWAYDIETDRFYEVPHGVHQAALRAFDEWRATATDQTPSSPDMIAAHGALRAAINQAKGDR